MTSDQLLNLHLRAREIIHILLTDLEFFTSNPPKHFDTHRWILGVMEYVDGAGVAQRLQYIGAVHNARMRALEVIDDCILVLLCENAAEAIEYFTEIGRDLEQLEAYKIEALTLATPD